jgi:hypothetical protein
VVGCLPWCLDGRRQEFPLDSFFGPSRRSLALVVSTENLVVYRTRRDGGSVAGGWRRAGNSPRRSRAARATVPTARSKASSVLAEGARMPLTLYTYCRAAASISASVARGSSPRKMVMFRHMGR